jgi:hypothetical protein
MHQSHCRKCITSWLGLNQYIYYDSYQGVFFLNCCKYLDFRGKWKMEEDEKRGSL